ncbi:MAG TPA: hypothetical protein VGE52_13805, partial [Pirellulales bacterium]
MTPKPVRRTESFLFARRKRIAAALLAGLLASAGAAPAVAADQSVLDVQKLRAKQEAQERAREMARELVAGFLSVQLTQLEENGLAKHQIYRELEVMSENIDGLITSEMANVVELLVTAANEPGKSKKDREAAYMQARDLIREIVVRLSIERHNLRRRLKAAEISAQVKRLIEMESLALKGTKTLDELPPLERESAAIAAVSDQRDVSKLYLVLLDALVDVGSWGGEVGKTAAEGINVLKTAAVAKHLDGATQALGDAQFASAQEHEEAVIRGLK